MALAVDHLIYKLETEVSGRKIAEIARELASMGVTASKALPVLQRVREKVLREERYKYTRKMVVLELQKAMETISAHSAVSWETPSPVEVPAETPSWPSPEVTETVRSCPQCGAQLVEPEPGTLKFCTKCGTPLTPGPAPVPPLREAQCSACGATLPEGAKFCVECGAAVSGFFV